MTEEQRRQAAAQRCADLVNEFSWAAWEPEDFTEGVGVQAPLFNTILELDELARIAAEDAQNYGLEDLGRMARKHILATPGLSPIERLAEKATAFTDNLSATNLQHLIETLGLELREKKP